MTRRQLFVYLAMGMTIAWAHALYGDESRPDRDGDGTIDIEDECPDDMGPSRYKGCPVRLIDGDGNPVHIVDGDGDGIRDDYDLCLGDPNNTCSTQLWKKIAKPILSGSLLLLSGMLLIPTAVGKKFGWQSTMEARWPALEGRFEYLYKIGLFCVILVCVIQLLG